MIKIHPSSLGKIMATAKGKGPEALSVGAMTHCYDRAKEFVYGYKPQISSKYLEKGLEVEDTSIELYNLVFFSELKKNTERKENEYLTGECDLQTESKIIDIKSSWSLEQFPTLASRIKEPNYEWQGRAYMILWDKQEFELAYCMVSTPEHLIGYESEDLHNVDHIDPSLRITVKRFERCEEKDELIKIKCQAAQIQTEKYINEITNEHRSL